MPPGVLDMEDSSEGKEKDLFAKANAQTSKPTLLPKGKGKVWYITC